MSEMSNQQDREIISINQPIPISREDYDFFLQRKRDQKKKSGCHKFSSNGGGWGCTGDCQVDADYQEVCTPRIFYDEFENDWIYFCECMPFFKLPELLEKGEKIKAKLPEMPDTKFIPFKIIKE